MTIKSTIARTLIASLVLASACTARAADAPATNDQPTGLLASAASDENLHIEHLNPAFILSGPIVVSLVEKGRKAFVDHKSLDDVYKPFRKNPFGVTGEKGPSRQSAVVFNGDSGVDQVVDSYRASANYKPLELVDSVRQRGLFLRSLDFDIHLVSTPRIKQGHVKKDGTYDDVNVTNVVVTDDTGVTLFPLDKLNTDSQAGKTVVKGEDLVTSTVTKRSNSHTRGHKGDSDTDSQSTTTYQRIVPWSETHPYFEASYKVSFALFDEKGEPLIRDNAKKLILHIIRPVGEQQVEYDLKPLTVGGK
ncbi:MAG TPA: hypothetical protein VGK19_12305 [Capsulimonadaceae bacterium]|jgi:hypothetical protein